MYPLRVMKGPTAGGSPQLDDGHLCYLTTPRGCSAACTPAVLRGGIKARAWAVGDRCLRWIP